MRKNQNEQEQLSALMDGELSEEALKQLLDSIEQQPELRQQWEDHHAVRHTLFEKRTCRELGACGVADRVTAALQQEPTVLAPIATKKRAVHPWIPLALAASLATVTVLVMQPPLVGEQSTQQLAEQSVETEWVEIDGQWVERWVNPLDPRTRMRSYLVRHDEQRVSRVSTVPSAAATTSRSVAKRIVGWQVGWLPEGYREVDALQHQIPAFGGTVTHLVLSNGDSVFSVFIEKGAETGEKQQQMKGEKAAVNLYSYAKLGHRITVLGEVPMDMVRRVAQSIEAKSG